jgi:hypothetical protein
MKKLILSVLMGVITLPALSCDVCGAAVNTGGGEIIPGIFKNFLAARGNIRHFHSEHLPLFPEDDLLITREWFHTSEVFGRYNPHKRWQIFGFLPVNSVWKEEEGEFFNIAGIGDARLRVNYLIIDQQHEEKERMINLFGGFTLKAPTGRYQYINKESSYFHRNMLPGTGTWDGAAHLDFIYKKKDQYGFMLNVNYMHRTVSPLNYEFGDLFFTQLTAFHKFKLNKHTIMTELGVSYMDLQPDVDLRWNEVQPYVQGQAVSPLIRVNYFYGNWGVQAATQFPAWQNIGLGQVQQRYQFDFGIMYFL